jgi:hypothetical protein
VQMPKTRNKRVVRVAPPIGTAHKYARMYCFASLFFKNIQSERYEIKAFLKLALRASIKRALDISL